MTLSLERVWKSEKYTQKHPNGEKEKIFTKLTLQATVLYPFDTSYWIFSYTIQVSLQKKVLMADKSFSKVS